MKKRLIVIPLIIVVIVLIAAAAALGPSLLRGGNQAPAGGPQVVVLEDDFGGDAGGVTVQIEAEAARTCEAPFTVVPANDAEGRQALAVPQGVGKGKGRATYSVDIPDAGKYVVYARVYWLDGCSNSIRFTTTGFDVTLTDGVFKRWHILKSRKSVDLAKGSVDVTIHNVEDGVRVDFWGLRKVGSGA